MKTLLLLAVMLAAAPGRAAAPEPSQASQASVRRFALVVGANEGGAGRQQLRYATSDAKSFSRTVEQLGGVRGEDRLLLTGPRRDDFLGSLQQLGKKMEAARGGAGRLELVLYYSGHSDETGLLMSGERIDYAELREAIARVPADVRVIILDSCNSGAFVRTKGGRWGLPFLLDTSNKVRGHAFLTATSAEEAAQESDAIGASFFTNALLTGLRGVADTTHDGRVTLNEAYQFAFHETLARTEKTRGGLQHPAYDIQLAGTGDLVLTDLHGSSALLALGADLEGRLLIRDSKGHLVMELRKARGDGMELGLEPGGYRAVLESAGGTREAQFKLADGRTELTAAQFGPAKQEEVALRGGPPSRYRVVPVGFALLPFVGTNVGDQPVINYLALNLIAGNAARVHGVELGAGVNTEGEAVRGVQVAGGANVVLGEVTGAQIAGGFNYAGNLTGVQIGSINAASTTGGVQMAAINYAGSGAGAQVSAINVAGELKGVQVGAINLARKTNFMIGAVNIGEDVDAPLGLINIVRNGYYRLGVWTSDFSSIGGGVKMGGNYLYSTLGVGAARSSEATPFFTVTYGLGWHLPLQNLFLDMELTGTQHYTNIGGFSGRNMLTTLRGVVGWEPVAPFALIGGPTLNVLSVWDGSDLNLSPAPQYVHRSGQTTVRVYPGFVLGLQI